MAKPEQPRRRFAPVPIETTFETFRSTTGKQKHVLHLDPPESQRKQVRMGPDPEPTPEPSPREASPVPRELQPRRRFAPQLIETSRRSRRVGDVGPATKPTDKTDISPYTRNIYTATKGYRGKKPEARGHGENASPMAVRPVGPMRRESEDENVAGYLLELAAKEAERQMQETALMAFPNSHAREGGIDHFYFRESSGSDNSPESTSPGHNVNTHGRRRSSSGQDMNWWQKHMQDHAEHISHEHDEMAVDEPEPQHDTTQDFKHDFNHAEMAAVPEADTESDEDIGDTVMRTDSALDRMDLPVLPDPMWTTTKKVSVPGPIGETLMPLIQPDPYVTSQVRDKPFQPATAPPRPIGESPMPYVPSAPSAKPADMPFAKPSQIPPDTSFRNQASPFGRPFGGLGYKPPTPQFQKRRPAVSPPMLGKDLVFRRCPSPKQTKLEPDHPFAERHAEERYRDVSGQKGLWRGYCYRSESNDDYLVPADLHAPPMLGTLHREPKGLHRLHGIHGIDRSAQKEKNLAELDDKISQEFDDSFITQVYNYLSLGYPAMARAFDEELSQISLMSIGDLEKDDEKQLAQGHLVEAEHDAPREQRCPRWKALRSYIFEWARQHPNLDNLDPVGWGVRERRGSWAI
ncbi:hypothetical protein BGZ61DRAFT_219264 [Ilyonectria robusta]|uniref:uncharacterized protein n=1 Tax=Ilyonectria robusta TaxID=1079257 RepID=UPI001E8E32C3|nr:uncharacterized protein BGZ61DRAFT_219264 [Ilyonectria robusta]KAH8706295.1 hypothetical protein BGZ61DRAFT_219264 [Ilyonectria robusta]